MSRRQAFASLAAGLALLIAAPFVWWSTQPEPAGQTVTTLNAAAAGALVGASPVTPSGASSPTDTTAPATAPDTSSTTPGDASTSAAPTADASTSDAPTVDVAPSVVVAPTTDAPTSAVSSIAVPPPAQTAAPVATPVQIQVPALDVDAPVVPVGVTDTGALEIPDDVDEVGWYRFGPAPGALTGSAVFTGHVDDREQGPGALARLGTLQPGDAVTVIDGAGVSRNYQVLSREEWSKTAIPLDRLFDRGGAPRLVLITCGGVFDAGTGHYEDNIAITAVPVQ